MACQGHRVETRPLVPELKAFPLSLQGKQTQGGGSVEERAVSPVEAELAGRGAGKEERRCPCAEQ